MHGGRSAFNHLLCLAQSNGIPNSRVHEVLDTVGLTSVAKKKAKGFSLGMGQRLGIAGALLGDPRILMFDEPVNGLDPEGIHWIRNLMKSLAAQGRTVFVSSHLMSEMALTATNLVIVGRGRLLADTTVASFVEQAGGESVKVVSSDPERLRALLAGPDVTVTGEVGTETLQVSGLSAREIGRRAAEAGIALYDLTQQAVSLEEAFMALTHDAVEYRSSTDTETNGSVAA
jgi:ABC-2 type transport system ATP-binding protein